MGIVKDNINNRYVKIILPTLLVITIVIIISLFSKDKLELTLYEQKCIEDCTMFLERKGMDIYSCLDLMNKNIMKNNNYDFMEVDFEYDNSLNSSHTFVVIFGLKDRWSIEITPSLIIAYDIEEMEYNE